MSLQALLGVVRHLVVERIGVDVNYEVVRHLFGLLGSGWVELAGLRHPIRPRQERVHNLIGELAGVGHLGQQPLDVKPGIEPVGLGRGGDAVYRRRRPRAARRIAEEPVLPAYDKYALGLLYSRDSYGVRLGCLAVGIYAARCVISRKSTCAYRARFDFLDSWILGISALYNRQARLNSPMSIAPLSKLKARYSP